MVSYKITFLVFFAVVVCIAVTQTTAGLIIISPNDGQKIYTSAVNVRYKLTEGVGAASTPMFRLQLDGRDVLRTSNTEYTFTGLRLGTHTVTVFLVDANGTPVAGVQDQVQFSITSFYF
jgi:hypothetical protein